MKCLTSTEVFVLMPIQNTVVKYFQIKWKVSEYSAFVFAIFYPLFSPVIAEDILFLKYAFQLTKTI